MISINITASGGETIPGYSRINLNDDLKKIRHEAETGVIFYDFATSKGKSADFSLWGV